MRESVEVLFHLRAIGGGGAERVAITIANHLVESGIRCMFLVRRNINFYKGELDPRIDIQFVSAKRDIVFVFKLAKKFREINPQTIFTTIQRPSFLAVLAKRLAGIPARSIIREPTTPSLMFRELETLRERLQMKPMMRWSYHRADAVIAPSKGVRDDLIETLALPHEKISVIYNPVITKQLEQWRQEPVEHPWLAEKSIPVILAVGRLAYPKNYPLLIRAFALVREQLSARLLILGEGELRAEIEQLVAQLGLSEWVSMPGFDPNPFRYMARADVLALTSVREGFPNVLVQAMACGCPVVSTDCPSGPREILDGGKYGFLVPVNDEEALAEALLRTLKGEVKPVSPEWLEQFRAKHIIKQYSNLLISS